MEAQIITDRQRWNDFVQSSVCCNITQTYEWAEFGSYIGAEETLRVGVVDDAGSLCAAMLIIVSRAPVLKQTYFYAPRGPIIDDPASPALTVLLNYVKWKRVSGMPSCLKSNRACLIIIAIGYPH